MKFIVDKEARDALQGLCDIALKSGGIQNLSAVQIILASIQEEDPPPVKQEAN